MPAVLEGRDLDDDCCVAAPGESVFGHDES